MIEVKKAYICSPLSAPTQEEIRCNMHQARQHMKAVADKYGCRTLPSCLPARIIRFIIVQRKEP